MHGSSPIDGTHRIRAQGLSCGLITFGKPTVAEYFTPMWHHFVHLLGRSWGNMVTATSTNTLGFLMWTVALTAVGWTASLTGTWFQLKREKTEIHPFRKALRNSWWPGVFLAAGVAALVFCAWGVFSIKTVYGDHQSQVSANGRLVTQNKELRDQLSDALRNAEQRCEQAKQTEINGLRKRINAACYLPDRRLTDEQRDELFHLLKNIKKQDPKTATAMVCSEIAGDIDSWNFMNQLKKVFHDAEWTLVACEPAIVKSLLGNSIWRGLVLAAPNPNNWSMQRIESKFVSMGFDATGGPGGPVAPEGLHGLMLLVGFKVGYQQPAFPD
jgi:hypothetical protein